MKIGFSTLGFTDANPDEIRALVTQHGFQGIELDMDTKARDVLKEDVFLLSSSLCLTKEDAVEAGKGLIDHAAQAGARYLSVTGDTVKPQRVSPNAVAEVASQLCAYAAEKGVFLLIETCGTFADSQQMVKLLNHVKADNIGVLWDVRQPLRVACEPIRVTYKTLSRFIRCVRFRDSAVEDGQTVYKPIGQGTMPISDCVRLLVKDGYDGYLSYQGTDLAAFMDYINK